MKNLKFKNTILKTFSIVFILTSLTFVSSVNAQEQSTYGDMEKIQDENMNYIKQIHKIIENYPAFSYDYVIKDGKVDNVTVTGVDNDIDRKRLEVVLFDLKSNQNMLKNKSNRVGVFYSVDDEAKFKGGEDELHSEILDNLKYPEEAKNWGVEGTIYVKFVVDEDGDIPFATTSSDVETSIEAYKKDLEKQAVKAVEETSGEWQPAEVEGVDVASLAVVPVTFDFQKNPAIKALIY